jgi:MFS family permease
MSKRIGFLGLSKEERPAFWATFAGWGLDGFDYMIYTLVIVYLINAFHLTKAQAGFIGSVTLLASALGGVLAGTLSDRIGRVKALALAVFVYSLFTALSGFATSYGELLVYRVLEGLGFGGEWAVGAVLIAETVSSQHRGKIMGYVQGAWALGWGLAVLLSLMIFELASPHLAWRMMFWFGFLPALLVIFILKKVPEPEAWVKAAKTNPQSISFWKIFKPGLLRRTFFASVLAIGAQSGYYAIFIWLPTYLKEDRHLSVIGSGTYLFVVIAGSFAGYIFSGYINDLLGRKATFAIYAICSGTIILSYTHFDITNTLMLILSFPLGFFASGIFSGFGPFLSELFPTEARGAGQGFTYNFGRGVAAFAPAIVGILSQYYGLAGGISIFGPAAYLLCLISLLFLPETKGIMLLPTYNDPGTPKKNSTSI